MEEDTYFVCLFTLALSPHKRTWFIGRGTNRGDHTLRSGLNGCGLRRGNSALA